MYSVLTKQRLRRLPPANHLLRRLRPPRPNIHAGSVVNVVVCRARDWHCVRVSADPASAAPSVQVRRSVPARLAEVQRE